MQQRPDNQVDITLDNVFTKLVKVIGYDSSGNLISYATSGNQDALKLTMETSQQDLLESIDNQLKILNLHMSFITNENIREVN